MRTVAGTAIRAHDYRILYYVCCTLESLGNILIVYDFSSTKSDDLQHVVHGAEIVLYLFIITFAVKKNCARACTADRLKNTYNMTYNLRNNVIFPRRRDIGEGGHTHTHTHLFSE